MTQALTALANAAAEEGTKVGNAAAAAIVLIMLAAIGIACFYGASKPGRLGGRLLEVAIGLTCIGVIVYSVPKLF